MWWYCTHECTVWNYTLEYVQCIMVFIKLQMHTEVHHVCELYHYVDLAGNCIALVPR